MTPPIPTAREVLTEEQIELFLAGVREGRTRAESAEEIGMTGSQMRSFCRRERDPWFYERYLDALADRAEAYQDELHAVARDRKDLSDRILEVELATHGGPAYRHLRRDRVTHEGRVEHGIVLQLDPAFLDELPLDELLELRETLRRFGGDVIDARTSAGEIEAA